MAEEKIFIESEDLRLEGLLNKLPGDKGVVVSHPHPLYGGDMCNSVMETVCRTYNENGYSSLRFNFRGVGESEGAYGDGIGEQKDVSAALDYLSDIGTINIDLAGYSFGAWVNALGIDRFDRVNRMVMISPPVNFVDFSFLTYNPKIKLVVSGSNDDIAGMKEIERALPVWNPEALHRTIQGGDHFYWGKVDELRSIIHEFLGSGVSP